MNKQELHVINSLAGKPLDLVAEITAILPEIIQAVNESAWVSVDERLPVHDGIYLTYSPSSHGRKITTREMINGKWSGVLNITHWQPIQPPKGVE